MTLPDAKYTKNTLLNLLDDLDVGNLIINHKVQRSSKRWSTLQQRELTASVLRKEFIPPLFIWKREAEGLPDEVIDGQQRLTTLQSFRRGELRLPDSLDGEIHLTGGSKIDLSVYAGERFANLSPELKRSFTQYNVDVCECRYFSWEEIKDLYSRLNRGRPLSRGEKIKAFEGDFVSSLLTFLENSVFEQDGLSMSKNLDTRLEWLFTFGHLSIHGPGASKNVGDWRNQYRDAKPGLFDKWMSFLEKRGHIVPEFPVSETKKKLAKNWYGMSLLSLYNLVEEGFVLPSNSEIKKALSVILKRADDPKRPEHGLVAGRQQNDFPKAEKLWREAFLQELSPRQKDSNRRFTDDQVFVLFKKSSGKCCGCGVKLTSKNYHADHVEPHALGGSTTVENGQSLCEGCNKRKGSRSVEYTT